MKHTLLIATFLSVVGGGCSPKKNLSTVDTVELSRYTGKWYEIARLPNSFEKNLTCVTANYALKENGGIKVTNKGFNTEKQEWEEANGHAKVPDPKNPGELRVSFFRPFYGDYYIIELDPNYEHVLVGSPSRKYLWILARNKSIKEELYAHYLKTAKQLGFDTHNIHRTSQDCQN
jgi:apolipoprotein D and lipocalin family protein